MFSVKRRQRGDTIVEVMLAMAVVGMVLGVAYGIANRSVAVGRSAQERSEALKLAESQVELLKRYATTVEVADGDTVNETLVDELRLSGDGVGASVDNACLTVDSNTGDIVITKTEDTFDTNLGNNACFFGSLYQVSVYCVSGVPDNNANPKALSATCNTGPSAEQQKIIARVTWDRVGGGLVPDGDGNLVPQQDVVEIYYR